MGKKLPSLSPAQILGSILLAVSTVVIFFNPLVAAAIAFCYIVICVAASFFAQSSFYLPVISHGKTGKNLVALTFDDGPSPITRQILDLLNKYSIKATFFVSGVNALKYPDIIREIITRGHTIGNHSFHHNPFLMLGTYNYLYEEVYRAQGVLRMMGVNTIAFRPPVGIISPKLPVALNKIQLLCVTFSCYASDAGNRFVKNLSLKILKKVKADDIILLHDIPSRGRQDDAYLLSEVEKVLQGLADKGLKVVPLSTLIGKDIN